MSATDGHQPVVPALRLIPILLLYLKISLSLMTEAITLAMQLIV